MRIGDNGGEKQINEDDQESLEDEIQKTARYYLGVVIASPVTRYSLHQLFIDVNETVKDNAPLCEILISPEFAKTVIRVIIGPKEELHLAGLEIVNIFHWRDACKIAIMTQREQPKLKAFQSRLLSVRDLKKLILDRKNLYHNFFTAYRAWIQEHHPEKAGEIKNLPLELEFPT